MGTTGRVHINSCDFSLGSYSFDDVEDDIHLEHFDTNVSHDQTMLIPLIKAAMAKVESEQNSSLNLLASPWSPPAWMKSSRKMDGSGSPGLRANATVHHTWAKYISKWITAYKSTGIPIW